MFVQDIPKVLFNEFRESDQEPVDVVYIADHGYKKETWHVAKLRCPDDPTVICWYEIFFHNYSVSFLVVVWGLSVEDCVRWCSDSDKNILLETMRIRCGPESSLYRKDDILKDRASISFSQEPFILKYPIASVLFRIGVRATELWDSQAVEKRMYQTLISVG